MSGYHGGPIYNPLCAHGISRYQRCADCDATREAEELAERRRVHDPAQTIRDALDRQRPWFARCAFCSLGQASLIEVLPPRYHALDCPFITAMSVATTLYECHLWHEATLAKGQERR